MSPAQKLSLSSTPLAEQPDWRTLLLPGEYPDVMFQFQGLWYSIFPGVRADVPKAGPVVVSPSKHPYGQVKCESGTGAMFACVPPPPECRVDIH